MTWQLQEAKRRLSELVRRALRGEFKRLTPRRPDFKAFLLAQPDWPELEIERSREPAPKVEL